MSEKDCSIDTLHLSKHMNTVQCLLSSPETYSPCMLSGILACRYLDGITLSDYTKWRGRQNYYDAAEPRMVAAATALIQVKIEIAGHVFSVTDFLIKFQHACYSMQLVKSKVKVQLLASGPLLMM